MYFARVKCRAEAFILYGYKIYEAKNRSFNNRKSFEINFWTEYVNMERGVKYDTRVWCNFIYFFCLLCCGYILHNVGKSYVVENNMNLNTYTHIVDDVLVCMGECAYVRVCLFHEKWFPKFFILKLKVTKKKKSLIFKIKWIWKSLAYTWSTVG